MTAQLGMIPSWQFSSDPGVNIKLNPNVTFPEGWSQRTIQPVGSYYTVARIAQPDLTGLSLRTCCCTNTCTHTSETCCDGATGLFARVRQSFRRSTAARGVNGMGLPIARQLGMFDSWAFENRKLLVLGGLGLIAAAGVGITASILK